jgi:hypothetical protein
MSPARPRLSEEQQQQRELNARRDLNELVAYLVDAASNAWQVQRLWEHGDRGRLYFGLGANLSAAVDRLSKVILEHPDAGVRADRLIDLYDALEAATFIGGCLKTPAAGRLRTAAATGVRSADSSQRDEVLVEIAREIRWWKHPTWGPLRMSNEELTRFKEALEAQGLRPLAQPTIYDLLRELWPRIVSPPED